MTEKHLAEVLVAVTGLGWMGGDTSSVQSLIEHNVTRATDEIQIAAYQITDGASGLFTLLEDSLLQGVKITLIVNRFAEQPRYTQEITKKLMRTFPHFILLSFNPKRRSEDLHAKLIVVDRSEAIIGSPNLTWKGLLLNHEIAVSISGSPAAKIAGLLDQLAKDSRTQGVRK